MKLDKMVFLIISLLVIFLSIALFISCGDDDDDNDSDNDDDESISDDDSTIDDDDNEEDDDINAGDDDDICDCIIAEECFASGETNPENICLICDPMRSTVSWSVNDFTSCDDGEFCNGEDSCLDGECSKHVGVPCTEPWEECDEEKDSCVKSCELVWTHFYEVCEGSVTIDDYTYDLSDAINLCNTDHNELKPGSGKFECVIDYWDDCDVTIICVHTS